MLVLNHEFRAAWRSIAHGPSKYWIRLWQDGLYTGTHPEWLFSPLSIPCLCELWRLFTPDGKEQDWSRDQRRAIRELARIQSRICRFPIEPPTTDDDSAWTVYGADVNRAEPAFVGSSYKALHQELAREKTTNYDYIRELTSTIVAALQRTGLSDYELFVRGGTGIIDPDGRQSIPHVERVQGFLRWLESPSRREFVIWTRLLGSTTELSKGQIRKLASREIPDPLEYRPSETAFARVSGFPCAITRCESTHSLTAFLEHRLAASKLLRQKASGFRYRGLELAESSSVLIVGSSHKPWVHSLPRSTPFDYLRSPDPLVEAHAYLEAIEAVEYYPERTIELLCDAFDRRLGKKWPTVAARSYRKRLRGELARRVLVSIDETRNREAANLPAWLATMPKRGPLPFESVANAIRLDAADADELLAQRLEIVSMYPARVVSPAMIDPWLRIARGIRNRAVHQGDWPTHLRGVALFLARVLLETFVQVFPRNTTIVYDTEPASIE